MKILMKVTLPNEPFNTLVREGKAAKLMERILGELKPEAAYFTEFGGQRTGIMVVEMAEAARIPALAEPWFLMLNAAVEFHPAMTPADLARANLDEVGKKWSK